MLRREGTRLHPVVISSPDIGALTGRQRIAKLDQSHPVCLSTRCLLGRVYKGGGRAITATGDKRYARTVHICKYLWGSRVHVVEAAEERVAAGGWTRPREDGGGPGPVREGARGWTKERNVRSVARVCNILS